MPASRIAIVAGLRTPFARQGADFRALEARHLAQLVVRELLERTGVSADDVDQVVYGQVMPTPEAPNIAREVVLGTAMPASVDAYSISRVCLTGYQTTVSVAESIMSGQIATGISGGAESASNLPIKVSKRLASALMRAKKVRTLGPRLAAFKNIQLRDLMPVAPALKEASSELTMGESGEKMAKENGISRASQDKFAHRSHVNAARAWGDRLFDDQVMPAYVPPEYKPVTRDKLVREESKLENYARLSPVFDRRHGSVTAGNSCPLTDGASALLLMREDTAKSLGFEPLGYIRSYAFAALDPAGQMLMGPAYATPSALKRAGIELKDLDLIDMHEAFAAQVLSNVKAFESDRFAQKELGRDKAIGQIEWDRFNVSGGSIALGHPFAATGARQIMQALHDLRRLPGQLALCTACGAGGLGAAMVLEAT